MSLQLCCCALLLLSTLGAGSSRASYITSYTVNLDPGQRVTNILMLEEGAGYSAKTWAFEALSGTTVLDDSYAHPTEIVSSLLAGVMDNGGQKHIVLFVSDAAAASWAGVAWEDLFPNTVEDDLIAAIELATSGQGFPEILPALAAMDQFANGDARSREAWFGTKGSFSVLAFSNGQKLGTGTSTVTHIPDAPEPAGAGLAGLGLTAVALLRRRG